MEEILPPTPIPPVQPPSPKTFPLNLILIILIIIAIFSTGALFAIKNQSGKQTPTQTPQVSPSPTPTPDPTANWKTYTNELYGFSFKYPSNWKAKNQDINTGGVEFEGYEGNILVKSNITEQTESKCPNASEKTEIQLGSDYLPSCHQYTLDKSTEAWEQINKDLSKGTLLQIRAWAYSPIERNRNYVLKILSTFKFLEITPLPTPIKSGPTCRPRPACLDTIPPCLIAETADMCPPAEGKSCGGIAGIGCPQGYTCQIDSPWPDAGGKCAKE